MLNNFDLRNFNLLSFDLNNLWHLAVLYAGLGLLIALTFFLLSLKDRPSRSARQLIQAIRPRKDPFYYLKEILVQGVAIMAIVVGWPAFLVWAALHKRSEARAKIEADEPKFDCQSSHLLHAVSIKEAEAENFYTDPLGGTPAIPFGHLNKAWHIFLGQRIDGDQLRAYRIPKGSPFGRHLWMSEGDVSGYALLRNGAIVAEFVCEES